MTLNSREETRPADVATHGSREASPRAAPNEEDVRPWRGVFSPATDHDKLLSFEVEIRVEDLPTWEPQVIINPRWTADDDE
jgi:hypothetical protein